MDALPFHPVELVAIDIRRNIRRRWRMVAAHDLFGQVIVETAWGRIDTRGRTLARSFADEAGALRYCRALMTRRAGARRRIGVAYARLSPALPPLSPGPA